MGDFVSKRQLSTPLEPRDAFSGGRTNAVGLYHKVHADEKIHYMDITSLYAYVNQNAKYPMGHPEFIDQPNTTDTSRYFDLIKCKILPPYELYHPVLSHRYNNKLSFPLCRTCVEKEFIKPMQERNVECNHTPDERERVLTGTWCTPELQKAI